MIQAEDINNQALKLVAEQKPKEAVKLFLKAIELAPNSAEIYANLGNCYKLLKEIHKARQAYHAALQLKPNYAEVHNNLAGLFIKEGEINQAIYHLQKAIRLNPNLSEAHFNLANCFIKQDKWLDAIAHYENTLILNPNYPNAAYNLALSYVTVKNYPKAQELIEKLLTIPKYKNDIELIYHLALTKYALGEFKNAINLYHQVLAIEPNRTEALHNLATSYLNINDKENALKYYKLTYQQNSANQTAEHMVQALLNISNPKGAPIGYTQSLFDQYAFNYNEHVKNRLNYQIPYLLRKYFSQITKGETKALDILDLGCGTGLAAIQFNDLAAKIYGVDLSSNMLTVANQLGAYYKLYQQDIISFLTYPPNNLPIFDMILLADVLVYFGDLDKIIRLLKQRLGKNGYLLLSIETYDNNKNLDYSLHATGRYAHSPEYLKNILHKNNFEIKINKQEIIRTQDDKPVAGNIIIAVLN